MRPLLYELMEPLFEVSLILDRDGTINVDKGYTFNVSDLQIIDSTLDALIRFSKLRVNFFIATNQSGIARGKYSINEMQIFNSRLINFLEKSGVYINAVIVCPHLPAGIDATTLGCLCRKPLPGMINTLISKYELNPLKTYFVGNSVSDVRAGESAGIKSFQLGPNSWDDIFSDIEAGNVYN